MNYLIHFANALYLVSYLVKDILWLRLVTIVAGTCMYVYYFVQPVLPWTSVGWNTVFMLINAYQVYVLILERRPVVLDEREQRLYQLVFRSLTPREFRKLMALARWEVIEAAARIVERGQKLERMRVIFSGKTSVQIDGRSVVELREGQFVGEMSFLTAAVPSADVVAIEPCTFVSWPTAELKAFLADTPALRAAMQLVIGNDLVGKLRKEAPAPAA